MSVIRFFGPGKTRIQIGAPLRVLLMIESMAGQGEAAKQPIPCSVMTDELTRTEMLLYKDIVPSAPNGLIEIYGAEIDTASFQSGSYRISLADQRGLASAEEPVWLMARSDFTAMLSEELDLFDETTYNLFRLDSPALDSNQVNAVINDIFSERFQGSLLLERKPVSVPSLGVIYEGGHEGATISGDPLSFMATVLADECRDLTLWGAQQLDVIVTIFKNKLSFDVICTLTEPLSQSMVDAYSDPSMGTLQILNSLMKKQFDQETELDMKVQTRGVSISWRVKASAQMTTHA